MATEKGMRFLYSLYAGDERFTHLAEKSRLVPGVGSLEPRMILIGEAPGRTEEAKGEPFIGASGRFLNEMLRSVRLKREDVYITNVVKFRPPLNRDPTPEEVEASLPYLREEVGVLGESGCRLIATLGRHAAAAVLGEPISISKYHGHGWLKRGWTIYTLYHPAAGLYNSGLRRTIAEDFKKIKKEWA